jgi:hypothetical protein
VRLRIKGNIVPHFLCKTSGKNGAGNNLVIHRVIHF